MSVFLEILRCILCCDEDEEEKETRRRNRDRNSILLYNPSEIVDYDTFRGNSAPNSSTYSRLTRQSDAQTTAQINHNPTPAPSWKLPHSVQTTDSISHRNSIPNKLPETLTLSSVKPKATIDSGIQHKNSSVLIKSHEGTEKPKKFPPSTSSTHIYERNIINSGTNKATDQRLPHSSFSFSSQLSPSLSKLLASSSLKPLPSSPPPPPVSSSSSASFGTPPSSPKPLRPSAKPTLSLAPSNLTNPQAKTNYICVQKAISPIYEIPEHLKDLFKKDVVPGILKKPLSLSTYKDYFDALLYAEDFYIEKWNGFEMKNVTLELHEAAIYDRKGKYNNWNVNDEKDDKVFVAFEIDSVPEKRPFLLSRDFVFVQSSGRKTEPFQGLIYRVVKSNLVLVEFGEDFHSQHYSAYKYDVKFSFNRVCLKREHQAIAAASDSLFRNFLFPDCIPKNRLVDARVLSINPKLDRDQVSAVRQILSHQSPPPYLVEGPISVNKSKQLSRTGLVVREAVLQIYRTSPSCQILLCAPTNSTCDVITRSLKEIRKCDMFRANAAFREFDGVPFDILPTCLYKEECFSCPSLQELKKFKVIISTFMSSFRLHSEGIMAGHFSHIFMVDASSATEPECMVALANLADETTSVIITGAPLNHSGWIRSNIARRNGLMISYFERLRKSNLYTSHDSKVFTQLEESRPKFEESRPKYDESYSRMSYE